MSTAGLFAMGVVVTLVVVVGLGLPIYGAILDGRDEAEHRLAAVRDLGETRGSGSNAA